MSPTRTSITSEFKQYGEIAVEQGKLALNGARVSVLAAVGAGDLLAERLVGRTQDLTSLRLSTTDVRDYLQTAGEQAVATYSRLSDRGASVVHEFRKDPRVQRVVLRAERTVDVVEDSLEDLLEEVAEDADTAGAAVSAASATAKSAVADGAEQARSTVRKTAARNTNARKSTATTAPARKAPARRAPNRKTPALTSTATAPARKASARKASAGKAPAGKAPAGKAPAGKASAGKASAGKASATAKPSAPRATKA